MIAGLEATITGGTVAIDGEVVNDKEPRERGCAMVFQNYALYPHFTVAENIGYSLKVAGLPKAKRQERILAVAGASACKTFSTASPRSCRAANGSVWRWPGDDPRAEGLPVRRATVEP